MPDFEKEIAELCVSGWGLVLGYAVLSGNAGNQEDGDVRHCLEDVIQRSIARLALYVKMDTEKADVSHMKPEQTANAIVKCSFDFCAEEDCQ